MGIIAPPGASRAAARTITPPAAFPWPFATYPLTVFGSQGRFSTDLNPRSLVNAGIWSTASFLHVDVAAGVDGTAAVVTDPSDRSKAAASISKAIQLGNATGGPFRIFVKAGLYDRAKGLPGTITPTQHCSIEAWGGKVILYNGDTLTYAADATFTSTYTASRTNVARVFDTVNLNSFGHYTELAKVADAATCNSTPNSWAQVGGLVYVRRSDGLAVTNANTRHTLLTVGLFRMDNFHVYMSGCALEGGHFSCVTSFVAMTRNLVFVDCSFRYSGQATAGNVSDCVAIDNMSGIAAFFRCDASAATKDGFNFHWSGGGANGLYVLTVDCAGHDNGRTPSTSNNGWTSHDGVVAIDINGFYSGNYGGTVHSVLGAQTWCVGTTAENSLGDTAMGGGIPSAGFVSGEVLSGDNKATKMWLDSTLARGNIRGLWVHNAAAAIYTRGHRSSGGAETVDAGGTLAAY